MDAVREEIKLLPCPFCGSKDVVADHDQANYWYVCCRKCLARSLPRYKKDDGIKGWNTRALDKPNSDGWVPVEDRLPDAKEGFEHTEQCLVWYQPTQDATGNFGIAYYHYNSPYEGAGWIDFAHLGRTPTHWKRIVPPPTGPKGGD